jgi:hypothetical protein
VQGVGYSNPMVETDAAALELEIETDTSQEILNQEQ